MLTAWKVFKMSQSIIIHAVGLAVKTNDNLWKKIKLKETKKKKK